MKMVFNPTRFVNVAASLDTTRDNVVMAGTTTKPKLRSDCVFVLGAKDPEMRAIHRLLDAFGLAILPATHAGKRVYPGNAYVADPPSVASFANVYAVECGWPSAGANVRHIDHHHPGDVGYGKPPAEYFAAASIGQVFALLTTWLEADADAAGLARLAAFSAEAHLVAAADHCLGAALRGECPGVDGEAVYAWCIAGRAKFQRRSVADVAAEVEASIATIRQLARDGLADLRNLPDGTVADAPFAACRAGIAVLSRVVDRDGRTKIGLLGATPAQVRAFLAGTLVPGLRDSYGDPARGFAGGYLTAAAESARKA